MDKPLFSVIILTHNRSTLLKEALQSVLDQTYKNFELIIIDDRSTDDTKDVVAAYKDSRIKYFINDRKKGQPGARNAGISRSSAEWITFLDDDDIWLPLKLEKQYQKIQEVDDTVGLIYTGYASYDFERRQTIKEYLPEKEGWIQKELLYKNYIGAICSVALKTDLFKTSGGFDEDFQSMVDLEMWVRISGLAKIAFIKDILVYVRKSNDDRISLDMERKINGSMLFWEKYKDIINVDPRLRHRAASRVFIFAFQQGSRENILKALPWTLLGLFYDLSNFSYTLRNILNIIYKSIFKPA